MLLIDRIQGGYLKLTVTLTVAVTAKTGESVSALPLPESVDISPPCRL